jgi:hypothetical protein
LLAEFFSGKFTKVKTGVNKSRNLLKKLKFLGFYGGIAQLGERLHGMQEVIGSIPFTSTIKLLNGSKQRFCKGF